MNKRNKPWFRWTGRASVLAAGLLIAAAAAGVGLAFVAVWISYVIYAAVAVMWLIPDRRFTRTDMAPAGTREA